MRRTASISALVMACLLAIGACSSGPSEQEKALKQARYHYQLGNGYYTDGNVQGALGELMTSLRLDPTNGDAHHLLGIVHLARREFLDAAEHIETAVKLQPKMYTAQNNLGVAYLALCRWDEALRIFEGLVRQPLYATPWLAHNNLGWASWKTGRREAAIRNFKKAVFFSPQFCVAYNNLGIAYLDAGRFEDAERALAKAIDADPVCAREYAEPHLHLARLQERLGRPAEACQALAQCVAKAPPSEADVGAGCDQSPVGERCSNKAKQLGCELR